MRLMFFLLFAGGIFSLWLFVVAVALWRGRAQGNRKFNRQRGRALVRGLVRSGGVR